MSGLSRGRESVGFSAVPAMFIQLQQVENAVCLRIISKRKIVTRLQRGKKATKIDVYKARGEYTLKKREANKCQECSEEISEAKAKGRPRKFCSEKCMIKFHKGRQRPKTDVAGGISKCINCGNEFERGDRSKRSFCTRKCAMSYGRRDAIAEIRKKATEQRNSARPEKLKDFVLELHAMGYGCMSISEAMGLSLRAIRSWIEDNNNPCASRRSRKYKQYPRRAVSTYSYEYVETAEEWIEVLKDKMKHSVQSGIESNDTRPVYLICGTVKINQSAENLSDIVYAKLGITPFDGGVFAFCGNEPEIIKYIFCSGSNLRMIRCRKSTGTYPWPPPKLGKAICINMYEFELILNSESRNRNRAISWGNLDLPK